MMAAGEEGRKGDKPGGHSIARRQGRWGRGGTSGRKIKGEGGRGKMLREMLVFRCHFHGNWAFQASPTSAELLDNSILPWQISFWIFFESWRLEKKRTKNWENVIGDYGTSMLRIFSYRSFISKRAYPLGDNFRIFLGVENLLVFVTNTLNRVLRIIILYFWEDEFI